MICSNKECAKEFDAKTHNQKYCSDECCRIATNIKIKQKYYDKKARLAKPIKHLQKFIFVFYVFIFFTNSTNDSLIVSA